MDVAYSGMLLDWFSNEKVGKGMGVGVGVGSRLIYLQKETCDRNDTGHVLQSVSILSLRFHGNLLHDQRLLFLSYSFKASSAIQEKMCFMKILSWIVSTLIYYGSLQM